MNESREPTLVDFAGNWQFGVNRVRLSLDGTFELISATGRMEGTFEITKGTKFGQGRWISPTGYFLQLNPHPEPGRLTVPLLHQIEDWQSDCLTLRSPLKNKDGTYVDQAVTCPRQPATSD